MHFVQNLPKLFKLVNLANERKFVNVTFFYFNKETKKSSVTLYPRYLGLRGFPKIIRDIR